MKPPHQKSLPLLLALLLAAPLLSRAAAPASGPTPTANEPILVSKLFMRDAPVAMVMDQLAGWLGSPEVIIEPEALAAKTRFDFQFENATKDVAVGFFRDALMARAGVRYEELPDGVLHFTTVLSNGTALPFDRANAEVSVLRYAKVSPELILRRMKVWSGKEIRADAALLAGSAQMSLQYSRQTAVRRADGTLIAPSLDKSFAGVFAFARTELEKQAGIVLDEQPDGSYRARLAAKPAPPAAPAASPKP